VNFEAKTFEFKHFANRRAEICAALRVWFDDPAGVSNPDSDALQSDPCAPASSCTITGGTRFNSSGHLALEDKDHMKKRLSFSPDLADAGALTFAIDLSRVKDVDWDEPGRRPAGGWLSD
jgi:hypothetical protein